jgi:hypothetical protein
VKKECEMDEIRLWKIGEIMGLEMEMVMNE